MSYNKGWIKSYRTVLDNPTVTKSTDHMAVWVFLLHSVTGKPQKAVFRGQEITLRPGQLITGRKKISAVYKNLNESKVQRVLKDFENAHQIEQQTSSQNRLITIVNWDKYQNAPHQNKRQWNNRRTTAEQRENNGRTHNKNTENTENNENVENERGGTSPDYRPPETHFYGTFNNVSLTDGELAKLKDKYPDLYRQKIERLSGYIASKGKEYKNHYAVLLQWLDEDTAKDTANDTAKDTAKEQGGKLQDSGRGIRCCSQAPSYDIEQLEKQSFFDFDYE